MTELPVIFIDDRGRFHRNVECLYIPQPKNGEAQCILCANDGYQLPFTDASDLSDVVSHARSLAGANFDTKLVIEFALDTPSEGCPDPSAWRLAGDSKDRDRYSHFTEGH